MFWRTPRWVQIWLKKRQISYHKFNIHKYLTLIFTMLTTKKSEHSFGLIKRLFVWFNIHLLPFYPSHRCKIFLIIFFSCWIFLKKTQFKWNKQKNHLFFFQINNNFVKSFYINYQEKKIVEEIVLYHGSFVQAIVATS